jgi:hypothetical protein
MKRSERMRRRMSVGQARVHVGTLWSVNLDVNGKHVLKVRPRVIKLKAGDLLKSVMPSPFPLPPR